MVMASLTHAPRGIRRLTSGWQFGIITVLLLRGCGGTTPIKELLDDPARFDGKTVRIAGEVQQSVGALGFGAYEVKDATGSLPVVSETGGAPRAGAQIGVEGTFRSAFTVGSRTAAVLVEKRRYSP
jgi:hypothetical protein